METETQIEAKKKRIMMISYGTCIAICAAIGAIFDPIGIAIGAGIGTAIGAGISTILIKRETQK